MEALIRNQTMSENLTQIRHDRSVKDFPFLKLEPDEYVEFAFKRARISLALILGGLGLGAIIILLAWLIALIGQPALDQMGANFMYIILGTLMAVVFFACLITFIIYRGNRLFITNKHVIQMVMTSPLASSVNLIDLPSVEDVSFHQNGLAQKLFGFGTLRLATIGDETTYTFKDSDIKPEELKAISKLITEAKEKAAQKAKHSN
ncbi:PH domain-containing protein [Candidatus Saccharibacteria bacterium]|nr:PH domain-containing protein [Candidatus Saccharibacteria bacterium]